MTAFVISNAGGNWNAAASYVANSGFPVAGDTVTATATSGNLTVNVASACASIILTDYVGTLTFNSTLTTTSTVTFVAGMNIAGTAGTLISATTSTLTSGGKTLTCALTLTGTATYTLNDDWSVNGLVTLGGGTLTTTINANAINCAGGLSIGGSTSTVTGTSIIRLSGTGTFQSSQSGAGALANSLTINAGAGTVTVSGTIRYKTGTILYTSGTMSMGSSVLQLQAAATLNTTGMTWANILVGFAGTTTLASALQTTDLTFNTTGTSTFSGAFNITTVTMTTSGAATTLALSGNITCSGLWTNSCATSFTQSGAFDIAANSCTISGTQTITLIRDIQITGLTTISDANVINGAFNWKTGGLTVTGALTGTSTIVFNGTGTWQGAAACSTSVTINTAGTLTLSGTILFAASGAPTLTYTAGTISAGSSILSIALSCTLDTSGMTWANVVLTAALTLTLTSLLRVSDTLTLPNAAVTFATSGFTVGTFTNTTITATRIYTFATLQTFTVTAAFTTVHAAAQTVRFTFTSSSGTTRALFVLGPGATQDVGFLDPTRIDASGGQPIFSYHGTITDSPNWYATMPLVRTPPQMHIGM